MWPWHLPSGLRRGFFYEGSANGEPCVIQATGWVNGVELFAFEGVGAPQPGDTVTVDLVLEPLDAED